MSNPPKNTREEKLKAFEALVDEYEGALLRYATRVIRDPNAAQDVVQETFIRLFEHWKEEFSPSGKLSSWLYRVAHNCAVDYMRKESRRYNLHLKHSEETDKAALPDRGKDFAISDAAAKAASVLHKLDLRDQQLVILKVYEEKSYKEISDITGLTVSNVGYILHHAMKKMAEELKKAKTI